jgi:hypothetical protein
LSKINVLNSNIVCTSRIINEICFLGIANNGVDFADSMKYGYEFNAKTTIIPPTGSEKSISEISIKGKANVIGTKTCGAVFYLKRIEITQGSKVDIFPFLWDHFFFFFETELIYRIPIHLLRFTIILN